MRSGSIVGRTSAIALVLLAIGLTCAPPATAAAFRYWTYLHAPAATWVFATDGPATAVPADGAVDGWRFAVTTQAGSSADTPSVTPTFEALCGATAPISGSKRVGLVIDPGPAAIAPTGQAPPRTIATCVVVPVDATGFDVLTKVAPVRTDGGLICSLAGYPTGECAPVLGDDEAQAIAQALAAASTSPASPSAAQTVTVMTADTVVGPDSGSPLATIAVAGLLLVAAASWAVIRRRRNRGGIDG